MPKNEFDIDDPLELSGVALATEEDTTEAMCECFIDEFMRLGYNHRQILALFRNPHYLGTNMVLQNRGEAFVRTKITEVFARWGKVVEWPVASGLGDQKMHPVSMGRPAATNDAGCASSGPVCAAKPDSTR